MTFAFDHAPSKYVQIEQSTDTFTAFSHVQYLEVTLLCTQCFYAGKKPLENG